jgi:ribosomal protein L37E
MISQSEIAKKLTEKKATLPCHRCGGVNFTVLEGFSNILLQESFNAPLSVGGASVPVVHIACNNCGALTPHAVGALGLLAQGGQKNG